MSTNNLYLYNLILEKLLVWNDFYLLTRKYKMSKRYDNCDIITSKSLVKVSITIFFENVIIINLIPDIFAGPKLRFE